MKKFYIILIALLLGSGAMAQTARLSSTCLPEGITFSTQTQIDNFQTNYPGCTEIEGNVAIQGGFSITNLNGLSVLTSIGGGLHIYINHALTSLTGLDNLTSIEGTLLIESNDALTSLAALENLISIGGDLKIYANRSLSTCNAQWLCDYLSNPNGSIMIFNNAEGCNSVIDLAISCGGSMPCLPYGNYGFYSQTNIDNFQTAFPNCSALQDNVTISGSDITNLSGLDNLTYIGGTLLIHSNPALTSLTGLDNMTSLGGTLLIQSNPALTSLTGLDNMTSIEGSLRIFGNSALTSLTGLENLTSIGDGFGIGYNDALTSLTGLDNMTSIGGNLSIYENHSLSTCNAQWLCDYLTNPNGSINIYNNAAGCNSVIDLAIACGGSIPCLPYGNYYFYSQTDIDSFQTVFLNCSSLQGNVTISESDITNLSGLDNLTSIGGGLVIRHNSALTSLTGLENLTSIEDGLLFMNNHALTSLTELKNLTSIGGYLEIYDNATLTSLTGLENLTSIGGYLNI